MEWETYIKLWPAFRKTNRVHLQGWGEPLLNPHFFSMVELGKKAGADVSTTCGILMNEEIAERIVKSGMDIVAFSLAGTDRKSSHMRKGTDFEKVCDSIRLLQEIRRKRGAVHLEIHIAYLLLWDERDAVLRLPELMNELGIHGAVISTLDYIPSAELEDQAVKKSVRKKDEVIKLLKIASDKAGKSDVSFHFNLSEESEEVKGCSENIRRSFVVSAIGDISPCVLSNINGLNERKRRIFGNVNGEDVLDIWEKESFSNFRGALYSDNPGEICRGCLKINRY